MCHEDFRSQTVNFENAGDSTSLPVLIVVDSFQGAVASRSSMVIHATPLLLSLPNIGQRFV